ncbi:hypothetical protein BaRGS_00030233 [Batillaria attramentaria]|uniref:Uncharacterized protein n=1 Tax=Batillaria attramentaria TaxID=370345 RepID=A0ABD0JUS2_9CAEN
MSNFSRQPTTFPLRKTGLFADYVRQTPDRPTNQHLKRHWKTSQHPWREAVTSVSVCTGDRATVSVKCDDCCATRRPRKSNG